MDHKLIKISLESLSAKSTLLACQHASIPALCPIHVRKSRAQWSPAAEFYSFSHFIISFMFISGV